MPQTDEEKFVVPPELKALDSTMQATFIAQNAPDSIFKAWEGFLRAVAEWKKGTVQS